LIDFERKCCFLPSFAIKLPLIGIVFIVMDYKFLFRLVDMLKGKSLKYIDFIEISEKCMENDCCSKDG